MEDVMRGSRFAAAALALGLAAGAAEAEPLKLRIVWANVVTQLTPLIPEAPKEVYRHYGKSYVVEPTFIAGAGPALTAIASGEAELGALAPQSLYRGVTEAKLDLRAIAQVSSTEVPGYAGSAFWVRAAEIKRVEDLKGKTIAVNARGGAGDATAIVVLRRYGMEPDRDYQFVELRFPSMLPALESKRVDAAFLVLPFSLAAEKKPELKPIFTSGEAFGPSDNLVWVGRADFVAKNRAVLVDFIEDTILFRRWLYDPKTRMDGVRLLAKVAKQPTEGFEEWVFSNKDSYRDPHALINLDRYQKNIDDMHKYGLIPTTVDIKKHIDVTLSRDAAARARPN
jgi:NitT/TauT family transport system substrate-binding protein